MKIILGTWTLIFWDVMPCGAVDAGFRSVHGSDDYLCFDT